MLPTTDLTPTLYARPTSLNETGPVTVVVDVLELNNVASSGLITLQISKDAGISLSLPASATVLNGRTVTNKLWKFDDQSNEDYYLLTTTPSIKGGG